MGKVFLVRKAIHWALCVESGYAILQHVPGIPAAFTLASAVMLAVVAGVGWMDVLLVLLVWTLSAIIAFGGHYGFKAYRKRYPPFVDARMSVQSGSPTVRMNVTAENPLRWKRWLSWIQGR